MTEAIAYEAGLLASQNTYPAGSGCEALSCSGGCDFVVAKREAEK